MKMEIKNVLINTLWIVVGLIISDILYFLRFMNPLLRKELIMFMEKGNGYFLPYITIDIIGLLSLIGIYFYVFHNHCDNNSRKLNINIRRTNTK